MNVRRRLIDWAGAALPGATLSGAVACTATVLEDWQKDVWGRPLLEQVALAILLGAALRLAWRPDARFRRGLQFAAKTLLEIAVVLLGASVSGALLGSLGLGMLVAVAGIVVSALTASYGVGRALGLTHRMAVLVACGNSICGNSAIAAVAPAIGAEPDEVAASIGLTAVLGVAVVLLLPALESLLRLSTLQYGALAGLTVYAVPQVLAATAPIGGTAVQAGTVVKLARVLMLGPVSLSLAALQAGAARGPGASTAKPALTLGRAAPWFILGFIALIAARSAGALPLAVIAPMAAAAKGLTTVSMAALGLETDIRAVARSGLRVGAATVLSLVVLTAMSLWLVEWRLR